MKPRNQHQPSLQTRSSIILSRQTRSPMRSTRPSRPHQKSTITTAELTSFALTCIQNLAFPDPDQKHPNLSVEQTIANVILDKLPSYNKLRTTLLICQQSDPTSDRRYTHPQTLTTKIRQQIQSMQKKISSQLIQTGTEIGLPKPLIIKLADVTDEILCKLTP